MIELMVGNRFAAARPLEAPPHPAQDEQIDGGNGEQENADVPVPMTLPITLKG